ncbi:MAG: hypothetical protein QME57_05345, partial [Patescibacteria group bacterium]|nr:hypothetical protein [Patescibacteria group bacterium]
MPEEESIYISLQGATKYCNYSQEYLSLRARQGKLKAIKFGRNWVTKKEWLEEYLKKVKEYNESLKKKKIITQLEKPTKVRLPQMSLQVRTAFIFGLALVLLGVGIVFGKE